MFNMDNPDCMVVRVNSINEAIRPPPSRLVPLKLTAQCLSDSLWGIQEWTDHEFDDRGRSPIVQSCQHAFGRWCDLELPCTQRFRYLARN
jgi:hypothetical protein